MRFGSLFAGIGGLDLGLERAGMECAWQVELDEFCQKVLTKHWPDVPKYGDIHDVGRHNLEAVDLICGGFPCQPVSLAGRRQAQADPRWLWPEFARVVDELRPRYVLVENVPGLYSAGGSKVLADLAAFGYDAEWDAIPAAALGAPYKRFRIFLVAYVIGTQAHQQYGIFDGPSRFLGQPVGTRQEAARQTNGMPSNYDPTRLAKVFRWTHSNWWSEPNVGRLVCGVPARVDRLRALGNAVVPQVAEWVGRRILAAAQKEQVGCVRE